MSAIKGLSYKEANVAIKEMTPKDVLVTLQEVLHDTRRSEASATLHYLLCKNSQKSNIN